MSSLARQYNQQYQNPTPEPKKGKWKEKRAQANITKGEKILYFLAFALFIGLAGVLITIYASIYQANISIHETEKAIQEQLQINEGLQLQVIELSAPDRILHIATEKLGMTLNDHNVRVIQN